MQKLNKIPLDFPILLLWMVLAIVLSFSPFLSDSYLKQIITLPVLLFIPGYIMTIVFYPKKEELESIERLALGFGISIATAALFGLILRFTYEIKLNSLMIVLCLYTVILIFIAAYKQGKLPEKERFSVQFNKLFDLIENEFNINRSMKDRFSTGILIFSIVLAISLVYFVITVPKIGEKFTEFYILGPEGKADNYSTDLKYNYPSQVIIGTSNHEYIPVNYTVQVLLDNTILTDTWFKLNHNETREQNLTFIPERIGNNMKLEFWLFKEDNFTAPYRELYMWVNIGK